MLYCVFYYRMSYIIYSIILHRFYRMTLDWLASHRAGVLRKKASENESGSSGEGSSSSEGSDSEDFDTGAGGEKLRPRFKQLFRGLTS